MRADSINIDIPEYTTETISTLNINITIEYEYLERKNVISTEHLKTIIIKRIAFKYKKPELMGCHNDT